MTELENPSRRELRDRTSYLILLKIYSGAGAPMLHYSTAVTGKLLAWSIKHQSVVLVGLAIASAMLPQPVSAASNNGRSAANTLVTSQVSSLSIESPASQTLSTTAISSTVEQVPQFNPYPEGNLLLAQAITPANDGTGTVVDQSNNTFNITGGTQAGANLFHSFEQFGLDANQTANIISNPDIANVLGRVVGGDPSIVNGLLQVTGGNSNLFLMNPAGIIFGPNASVLVPGAFTATTANAIQIDDYWFNALGSNNYANLVGTLSGFAFTNPEPGAVINAGSLSGDSVTLLGGFVVNTGTIKTPGGNITVASVPGENLVSITQEGSLLSLELPTELQGSLNSNSPALTALDIPTLLSAENVPQDLGLVAENGAVKLISTNSTIPTSTGTTIVSGTLDASAQAGIGGGIDVLGDRVALLDATLQASGNSGGGTVRIGGDYQGQGTVPNAEQTHINAGSTISADALAAGDGGDVIVWANDSTRFYGTISAQGGSSSGNGGFAEVSGHQNLVFAGTADLSATNGASGVLLLDPKTIRIANRPSSGGVEGNLPDIFATDFPGNEITINAATLTSQTGDIILKATDDIIIENGLSLNFAPCTLSSCPSISFQADTNNDGIGSFLMDRTQSITASGRDVKITGAGITAGAITARSVDLIANLDDVIAGNISANANVLIQAGNQGASILTGDITAVGRIELNADQNILTNKIFDTAYGSESDGVHLNARTGNIRVLGIDAESGVIVAKAGGLFQATGVVDYVGRIFSPDSTLPKISIDGNNPQAVAIRNFLISQGLIKMDESFSFNEEYLNPDGSVFISVNTGKVVRIAEASEPGNYKLLKLIDIDDNGARSIYLDISRTPVSVVARTGDAASSARIEISHAGVSIPSNSNSNPIKISGNGNGNSQFVVGPQTITRPNNVGNGMAFQAYIERSEFVLAISAVDYLPLKLGSTAFPSNVSGSAGIIIIGLVSNGFVGATLQGIEYEPPAPPVPPPPIQRPPLLLNNIENLTSRSQNEVTFQSTSESEVEPKDSICDIFVSTEVLSVDEVAPEECQLSSTPEDQN
ncbi:MAG TPA: filamentous hemagglutinin N-terminal domain-containing protein [Leptolyngbyaceae cyanobacterium]